jgi:hypothetical protein
VRSSDVFSLVARLELHAGLHEAHVIDFETGKNARVDGALELEVSVLTDDALITSPTNYA